MRNVKVNSITLSVESITERSKNWVLQWGHQTTARRLQRTEVSLKELTKLFRGETQIKFLRLKH